MTQTIRTLRKQHILPAEHGSWSWFLVPYFVGTAVSGTFNLATLLVLIGGMALFLLRQPMTVWLRIRQRRGRKADLPIVQKLTIGLLAVTLLCFIGLLLMGLTEILILTIPVVLLAALYGLASLSKTTSVRNLWMELAGAAGLALMAPAAMIAATGESSTETWTVFGLMALQNVLGVFYVRLRIADTHERPSSRALVLWSHVLGITAVLLLIALQRIPPLAILPFIGFLIRAIWAYPKPRPIPNIKKFGFTEVGVEILAGVVIVVAFLL